MQQFHLQDEEVLKTERVTDLEAREIVHLWAENQKQAATHSGPTVHDIAEGLEIPPEEALRLLDQVRQRQVVQVEQRVQTKGRSALFVAAIIAAIIAVLLMGALVIAPAPTVSPATATEVNIEATPAPPAPAPAPAAATPAALPGTSESAR